MKRINSFSLLSPLRQFQKNSFLQNVPSRASRRILSNSWLFSPLLHRERSFPRLLRQVFSWCLFFVVPCCNILPPRGELGGKRPPPHSPPFFLPFFSSLLPPMIVPGGLRRFKGALPETALLLRALCALRSKTGHFRLGPHRGTIHTKYNTVK